MVNLPTFKVIEILKKENNSIINLKFENASMLLTGNYLIVMVKSFTDGYETTVSNIFNLSEIKSYKTI